MNFGARRSLPDVETFNLFSGETDESPSKTPGYEPVQKCPFRFGPFVVFR
jgi:hypothetical protein